MVSYPCVRALHANGAPPETVCTDTIKRLAMVFAAIESVQRGTLVDVQWYDRQPKSGEN
jgi:hypothetical protein